MLKIRFAQSSLTWSFAPVPSAGATPVKSAFG
jgi:hypothetical protein